MPVLKPVSMKKQLLFLIMLVSLFSACTREDENPTPALSAYDESVIAYFKNIALGFEFGTASKITRKWNADMKIFVGGQPDENLLEELDKIIVEVNELATNGFSMKIVSDSLQSNYYLFLGSGDDFVKMFPGQEKYVSDNWGLFYIAWNGTNYLYKGHMYVDIVRAGAAGQKHLLREELTQSLGLAQDSPMYPESIFQSAWTTTTEYAPIDRDVIRLLYHPNMRVGLNEQEVDEVLREILTKEQSL